MKAVKPMVTRVVPVLESPCYSDVRFLKLRSWSPDHER